MTETTPTQITAGIVTGVIDAHQLLIHEYEDGVDPDYNEEEQDEDVDRDPEVLLYGDWVKDKDKRWTAYDGYTGFAIKYNNDRNTVQVVKSEFVLECGPCSLCYPGQGNLKDPGKLTTYAMDPDQFSDDFARKAEIRNVYWKEAEINKISYKLGFCETEPAGKHDVFKYWAITWGRAARIKIIDLQDVHNVLYVDLWSSANNEPLYLAYFDKFNTEVAELEDLGKGDNRLISIAKAWEIIQLPCYTRVIQEYFEKRRSNASPIRCYL